MRMFVSLRGEQHCRQRELQMQGLAWERVWLVCRRERRPVWLDPGESVRREQGTRAALQEEPVFAALGQPS